MSQIDKKWIPLAVGLILLLLVGTTLSTTAGGGEVRTHESGRYTIGLSPGDSNITVSYPFPTPFTTVPSILAVINGTTLIPKDAANFTSYDTYDVDLTGNNGSNYWVVPITGTTHEFIPNNTRLMIDFTRYDRIFIQTWLERGNKGNGTFDPTISLQYSNNFGATWHYQGDFIPPASGDALSMDVGGDFTVNNSCIPETGPALLIPVSPPCEVDSIGLDSAATGPLLNGFATCPNWFPQPGVALARFCPIMVRIVVDGNKNDPDPTKLLMGPIHLILQKNRAFIKPTFWINNVTRTGFVATLSLQVINQGFPDWYFEWDAWTCAAPTIITTFPSTGPLAEFQQNC